MQKKPLRRSRAVLSSSCSCSCSYSCSWALALALVVGCGSSADAPTKAITMGVILDRTSQTGGLIAIPDVVQFAIDDVNTGLRKAGGYKGISFDHTDGDSSGSGTATISGQLATMLVQGGAKLVITDNSNNTIAVMKDDYDDDTGNDLNVPILCVLCSSPAINDPAATNPDALTQTAVRNAKKWNFRMIMASKYFAPIAVARALAITGGDLNHDGVLKASLYASNESQGQGAIKGFEAALLAARPTASIEKIFHDPAADPNGTLWATDSTRLADNRNDTTNTVDGLPDFVYESSLPGTAIAFTKAYVQGGYQQTIPLIHGSPFGNETATLTLGDLANGQEGVGFATYYPGASADLFIQRFLQHFGKMPESHERDGATTYDAIMLGALATMVAVKDLADPAQVTGAQIRDAMWMLNDASGTPIFAGPDGIARAAALIAAGTPINYQGVSGPLDFDQNAFVMGAMAHWVITNNHFVDQQVYDCTKDASCPLYVAPAP
jgi:hypothetical protein